VPACQGSIFPHPKERGMKEKLQIVFIYSLMGLFTLGYACAIRLGLGIFDILYEPEMESLSLVSQWMAHRSMIEFWQTLAWISLALNLYWGIHRSRKEVSPEKHALPCLCHLGWVLTCLFWNIVGALDPFISPAYVIR